MFLNRALEHLIILSFTTENDHIEIQRSQDTLVCRFCLMHWPPRETSLVLCVPCVPCSQISDPLLDSCASPPATLTLRSCLPLRALSPQSPVCLFCSSGHLLLFLLFLGGGLSSVSAACLCLWSLACTWHKLSQKTSHHEDDLWEIANLNPKLSYTALCLRPTIPSVALCFELF